MTSTFLLGRALGSRIRRSRSFRLLFSSSDTGFSISSTDVSLLRRGRGSDRLRGGDSKMFSSLGPLGCGLRALNASSCDRVGLCELGPGPRPRVDASLLGRGPDEPPGGRVIPGRSPLGRLPFRRSPSDRPICFLPLPSSIMRLSWVRGRVIIRSDNQQILAGTKQELTNNSSAVGEVAFLLVEAILSGEVDRCCC